MADKDDAPKIDEYDTSPIFPVPRDIDLVQRLHTLANVLRSDAPPTKGAFERDALICESLAYLISRSR